jgi:hypothetical protein
MNGPQHQIVKTRVLRQLGAVVGALLIAASCQRVVFNETKFVGTWEQVLMDSTKRLTFLSNHKVTVSMDHDGKFEPCLWGDWRVEGNRLILTLENQAQNYSSEDVYTIRRITPRKIDFDRASSFERIE